MSADSWMGLLSDIFDPGALINLIRVNDSQNHDAVLCLQILQMGHERSSIRSLQADDVCDDVSYFRCR
jgi:hypothetical protein